MRDPKKSKKLWIMIDSSPKCSFFVQKWTNPDAHAWSRQERHKLRMFVSASPTGPFGAPPEDKEAQVDVIE